MLSLNQSFTLYLPSFLTFFSLSYVVNPLSYIKAYRVKLRYCQTVTHNNGGYSAGVHLFPFRTEQLSPVAPMVLLSQAGE
jgi:hypothetical protein